MSAPLTSTVLRTFVSAAEMLTCQHLYFIHHHPHKMDSLIRPKTGNGLCIAQPGSNGFLRETFLPRPWEPSNMCQ